MTLLSKTTSRATNNLIRSPAVKQPSSITLVPRRYASTTKLTSNNPLNPLTTKMTSKAAGIPPIWSTRLFELPKPRPIDKQRYESTAGVLESASLVLAVAVVGTLYARESPEEIKDVDHVQSVEDIAVHGWIRPFDCLVDEKGVPVFVGGQAAVEQMIYEKDVGREDE